MVFHLQRLPVLALVEVFRKLSMFEILKLTQTSQWTRNFIKVFVKFPITLKIHHWGEHKFINLHNANDEKHSTSISMYEGGTAWKFGELTQSSIYENGRFGSNPLITFLSEHFVVKSVTFMSREAESYDSFRTLEHILNLKLKIEQLTWESSINVYIPSMAETILTAAIGASHFVLHYPPFHKFDRFKEYSMDYLKIIRADWITAQNLIDLKNCARVYLDLNHFTNLDFQGFCKHLALNENNVESWYISSEILNKEQFLDGLDWEKDGESSWRIRKANGDVLTVEASENGVSLIRVEKELQDARL